LDSQGNDGRRSRLVVEITGHNPSGTEAGIEGATGSNASQTSFATGSSGTADHNFAISLQSDCIDRGIRPSKVRGENTSRAKGWVKVASLRPYRDRQTERYPRQQCDLERRPCSPLEIEITEISHNTLLHLQIAIEIPFT
jgi:hypothetical protein